MRIKNITTKDQSSGFVILFAVTLSAILLSIALGIATIAEKEIKFSTSAEEANDAFVAADTGVECALFYDKTSDNANAFTGSAANSMSCGGVGVDLEVSQANLWTFALTGLGSAGESCARVTVDKRTVPKTLIISKGYDRGSGTCDPNNPNRTERQLEVEYVTQSP